MALAYQNVSCGEAIRLYTAMRSTWDEHVQLTRTVIISFAAGLSDLEVAKARLLQNPAKMVAVFAPYVTPGAGGPLQALLKQHLEQSVPVLQAAKAGDQVALQAAVAAWRQNASQIAQLLTQVTGVPYSATNGMMQQHLDTTIAEASARIKGQWQQDVAAYDAVRQHVLGMADMLSSALLRNKPVKLTPLV